MITKDDIKNLAKKNITAEMAEKQLRMFAEGFPFLKLMQAATPERGIIQLIPEQEQQALARWHAYLGNGGDVTKFVPASGAASRMFKSLFSFADGDTDTPAPGSDIEKLLNEMDKLPFIKELEDAVKKLYKQELSELKADGRNRDIIAAIIKPEGMNYGQLPKGLLTFHRYDDGSTRTPLEEQIMEGAQTAASEGKANLHFTVSSNHRQLFEKKIKEVLPRFQKETGIKFTVTLSEQKPSTDTIAANPDNTPFRDERGEIVTRPGGHGALIQNLNDLDSTVVFIKNIDNVVPDRLRVPTIHYKKILAGLLIQIQDRISYYLDILKSGKYTREELLAMLEYADKTLNIVPGEPLKEKEALAKWFITIFNRPIRVCGMVRNEGEPGGGPYIAQNPDGSWALQILESTQIDMSDAEYVKMMKKATHFNPVDLVCYIRDTEGRKFNLPEYVDSATGFISSKSQNGKELKALELPGLWNGAMSNWTTVFVEVPAETFNPVKTVNDLLRPAHQNA